MSARGTPWNSVSVDPELLAQARAAAFDIDGSPYVPFAANCAKMEAAIPDPATRMKAALAVSSAQAGELAPVLSTTHTAALQSFVAQVNQARNAKEQQEIGSRRDRLATLEQRKAEL